jgi:aminoglycoside phosphotransferase (APT) family kinase protein
MPILPVMQNTRERGGAGVEGEIRALLDCHLPGYGVRTVAGLGGGTDNAAYEVNGELVVRASKEADPRRRSESIRREAELLVAVAGFSTLPVPEPVFADAEAGVLAYFKLPGLPLMDQRVEEPARLAPALGGFVGHLHRAPLGKIEPLVGRDFYPLVAWREDAERDFRRIAGRVPAADRRLVENFLGRTPPAEPRAAAFCHNDLGAEHVLADARTGAVTGVIDWADAAIADPARDLALILRDLGPEAFDLALAHYGYRFDEADRERAAFYARCKLLENIAYGLNTPGAARYAEAGLAHLTRTFA